MTRRDELGDADDGAQYAQNPVGANKEAHLWVLSFFVVWALVSN